MNKLQKDYEQIINKEFSIGELEKLKMELKNEKENYYHSYFEKYKSKDFNLENIPQFDYIDKYDWKKRNILEPYSKMNVILIGEFIEYLLNAEGNNFKSKLTNISTLEAEYEGCSIYTYHETTPCVVIGNNILDNYDIEDRSIADFVIIPLKNYSEKKDNEHNIRGTHGYDYDTVFYSKSQNLIGSYAQLYICSHSEKHDKNELSFSIKGHQCIRKLILGIASYQKQNQIEQLDDKELERIFIKSYYKKHQY